MSKFTNLQPEKKTELLLGERNRATYIISQVLKSLNQNNGLGYQAFIDISQDSYIRLNELDHSSTLFEVRETLGSIKYRMSTLHEVCINGVGKRRLKNWIDMLSYYGGEVDKFLKSKSIPNQ